MNIKKLKENAVIPTYGSEYAAGADLYAAIDNPVTIAPGATEFIGTGLAMEIPMGYAGFVYARSGLSCKDLPLQIKSELLMLTTEVKSLLHYTITLTRLKLLNLVTELPRW